MGKMKEQFMLLRERETRHDDDAYHYEQWKSREREQGEERMLTSKGMLTNLFKRMGESYE